MSDDDRVTNKDVLNELTNQRTNHLTHIERNTEGTNKILNKIWWIFFGAFIFFAAEDIYFHFMTGVSH